MIFDMDYLSCFLFYSVLGLCIGSFLNVIIYRLPIMILDIDPKSRVNNRESHILKSRFNLFFPRSFCPDCYQNLPLRYNIPLFGWLLLRGVTECCHQKINPRYVCVELLTAILTLTTVFVVKDTYLVFCSLLLVWSLIVLTFIDLEHYLLPDCITLALLWCGLILNINNTFSTLSFSVLGAAMGYIFLWLPYFIFKFFKNVEGMGYGDFKLMAALGAWFGITSIPYLVFFSSFFGITAYIITNFFLNKKIDYIAFGPYISLAGVVYLFLGEYINLLLQ
ncbi:prepilin peptidase [Yersinia hibernica]|uniref:Prepilin leader peptidase/N-methyltransferase n=1 Tax=Yersinia enterocolitica LC20 TaxID=1443113 RepID=A0A7U4GDA3_YEREN|nr:A24 family peptidase [Yersinia hibernica]AHM72336.2 prepilin peptidase [Yersinia hibernica]OVZ90012.1 prepilin peptidase [Yersinia kristensenii]